MKSHIFQIDNEKITRRKQKVFVHIKMKSKILASICIFYWGVVVSTEDLIEKSVELAENAENVCIDQKVQNQIINTTFIQTQVI